MRYKAYINYFKVILECVKLLKSKTIFKGKDLKKVSVCYSSDPEQSKAGR